MHAHKTLDPVADLHDKRWQLFRESWSSGLKALKRSGIVSVPKLRGRKHCFRTLQKSLVQGAWEHPLSNRRQRCSSRAHVAS